MELDVWIPKTASTAKRLRSQQRCNRRALVHRAVDLRLLIERQLQVEYFARFNLPFPNQLDQVRQVAAHRSRSTVQMNVGEKQLLTVKFDTVWNANITHISTFAAGIDRLHH